MAYLEKQARSGFDGAAAWLLTGVTFLLPLLFIPLALIPQQFSKSLLVAIAALLGLAFFVVPRMKERSLSLPKSPLLLAVWLMPLAYLISALFSDNVELSLVGRNLPVDSFVMMALMAAVATLVALVFRSKEGLFRLYAAFMASFFILALFQLLRLVFGPELLSFGLLGSPTANVLGSWNDLAIFFGLVGILSLITLVGLSLEGYLKIAVAGALAISLFFLAVINFAPVWWLIGGFALATFVYSLTTGRYSRTPASSAMGEDESDMRKLAGEGSMSFASLAVLAVTISFLFFGNFLGGTLTSFFGTSQVEVRPSWQATVDIVRSTYSEHALLGSGPGTFSKQWLLHKPEGINQSAFWNTDFATGIGFVPTSLVTTGALGALAWLIFFGLFLYMGFRALVSRPSVDPIAYYLTLSSYLGALYLWIHAVIYTPNVVLLFLTFLLTGIFLASTRRQAGGYSEREISFIDTPRLGFIVVLVLTLVFLGSIAGLLSLGQRYAAAVYFQSALYAANVDGNLDSAEQRLSQSVGLNELDTYYRFGTNLNLVRLNQVVVEEDTPEEELRSRFQATLGAAIQNAQRAISLDPQNYQNWLTLGQVYLSVVPLGVEGADQSAREAYNRALELNPKSPEIHLSLARLALAGEDADAAREEITTALQLKNNYTQAIFLLAQIQINEGDVDQAINSVVATTIIEPQNATNFFQLGLLFYSEERFEEAAQAFTRAVNLSAGGRYANARYFLGLALYEGNDTEGAIEQFESIAADNPDNENITSILENLRAGAAPLGASTPSSPAVETLEDLPVEADGEPELQSAEEQEEE